MKEKFVQCTVSGSCSALHILADIVIYLCLTDHSPSTTMYMFASITAVPLLGSGQVERCLHLLAVTTHLLYSLHFSTACTECGMSTIRRSVGLSSYNALHYGCWEA